MKKNKTISIMMMVLLVTSFSVSIIPQVGAADEADIELSISNGIAWLVSQQEGDGKWQDIPRTGFVLIKLQDRAIELELDPFETDPGEPDYYEYATNVIAGWEYLFTPAIGPNDGMYAQKQTIGNQDHTLGASGTIDDPDTRVNGYGIRFDPLSYPVYSSGICLMALSASKAPNRLNDGGIDYDVDGNVDTFMEIAQDVVDWFAFAQADVGTWEGGYSYMEQDNLCGWADNSNSGYAYLGLAAAEEFGCTVPQWVKTELNVWIDYIQNDQGPADDGTQITPDGGSGYGDATSWVNELKTGNLIFEMTFYGDNPSAQRFKDAIDYIERHWNDLNMQPGFRGDLGIDDDMDGSVDEDPYNGIDDDGDGLINEDMGLTHHYQAIYCLMKGLEYSGISHLDLDMDNIPEHNWFAEFADMLIGQQNADGSWPSSPSYVWEDGSPGTMSGDILSTVWALLTLERIAPPTPPFIEKHFTYTDVEFTPYVWEPIEFYLEDFEADCPPVGWTIYEAPINGDTWICNNILTSSCEYGGASGIFMEFDDDDYGSESDNPLEELITAPIDCSIYRNIYLSFDGDFEDMASGGMFWVHISNDGGLTWTEVLFVTEDLVGGFPAHPDIPIDISSLADFESDVRIKFTYSDLYDGGVSSWGWGVLIDNVRLNGEHYVLQQAELGTPLDSIDIVIRGKNQLKVKSTNPGQFYAVATITGHIQDLVLYDIFDEEFDVNPAKLGGGVEVIMVDPDGYATVLTDHPGVSASVYNDDDEVWVYVYLDDPIPIGHKLMIYIKFQTSMKHEEYTGDDEFENTFWLWDWDAGEYISTVTEALPINY